MMSLQTAPGIIDSQKSMCRVINESNCPVCLPAGAAVALARTISIGAVTEMLEFYEPDSTSQQADMNVSNMKNNNDSKTPRQSNNMSESDNVN